MTTSFRRWAAGVATLPLLAAAACSSSTDPASSNNSGPQEAVPVVQGGQIVIGAEQEPDCTDWIATCAGSIWGSYIMQSETIPTAFVVRQDGDTWVPEISPVLASEPVVEQNGDQQVITYELNPDAVWSDGEPITSSDFEYTALQIRDSKDVFDRTGYDRIASVETPDPQTAVLTLDSPYAGWRTLFSGSYGILPAHLLEGQDRGAIMRDGYDFSGGPWKIEKWERGVSVTLVPNDNYWGPKPKLDKVVFQFLPDTAAAFQALRSGQVDALYPSPQLDALSQIESGIPGVRSQIEAQSGNLEALWMNNQAFPFDSQSVRQAVAYSIDRGAIVKRLFGSLDLEDPAQSFLTPIVSPFAADDFSQYGLDLDKVSELMTGDGWQRDGDGTWTKDGEAAAFTILTLAGNKRRDLTVQILQSQLADAGFDMSIRTVTPADLFGTLAPQGDFQMGLYTLIDTYPDPTLSSSFASGNIPSDANGNSGINFARADVPGLDDLLGRVDTEIDPDARIAASQEADGLIAEAVPSLPLQVLPSVLLWNEKVGGPISINPVQGPFWNLEEWGIAE